MERLDRSAWPELRSRFLPDRPGPLVALHAIHTGCGVWWVDRWPGPRAGVAFAGGNLACWGEAAALDPAALGRIVAGLLETWDRVFVEPRSGFEALIRCALPAAPAWPRVVYVHEHERTPPIPDDAEVRRLGGDDAAALRGLAPSIRWIADSYGGADALAATATAWGAFADGALVSVAAPYFVGDRYEDVGVVTDAAVRGRGLSPACAARLVADIRARGRVASWTTSTDNAPSRRVAEKLGFAVQRDDALYVAGQPVPPVARRPIAD